MNAPAPRIVVPAIGAALAGGFCLGHVFVDAAPYALIVAPKAGGEHEPTVWNESRTKVKGALGYFDGMANTRAMAEAGSDVAKWALEQRIDGFDDWHIPSRQDLLVMRGNLEAAGAAFADNGREAFERDWYWSSTQYAANDAYAWFQSFGWGGQNDARKSNEYRVRLVRRLPI